MQSLPIDGLLDEITGTLRESPSIVIEAPPGAGKTTRVPWALMGEFCRDGGDVLVLQPRRIAARLAARRVALEHGETTGGRVGYIVRFDEAAGPGTRLKFITEGVLTRLFISDENLSSAKVLVFDEFHERHIQSDLGLALARRLQRTSRPDLKIVVMSATMDAGPVARWLGARCIRSAGRFHELRIEFMERVSTRPLHELTAAACRDLAGPGGINGDILAFLPGAAEIIRASEELAPFAAENDILICPLHGDMPLEMQDRAVSKSDRKKIILSTNVAETSVTIEGVTAVVDSGLARIAAHSAWSGLSGVRLGMISRASATQRAGRAGRTGPGRVTRLYTRDDFNRMAEFDLPEVFRADLCETVLLLKVLSSDDAGEMEWFQAPPKSSLEGSESLLKKLGALDSAGLVTDDGKRMARIPVHPRLARALVEGARRGDVHAISMASALLVEKDVRLYRRAFGRSGRNDETPWIRDLIEAVETDADGIDQNSARTVKRTARQFEQSVKSVAGLQTGKKNTEPPDHALEHALLVGFPDMVAKPRDSASDELVLSSGGNAFLPAKGISFGSGLLVALDAEERQSGVAGRKTVVKLLSTIEPDWLLGHFPTEVAESIRLEWNPRLQRVESHNYVSYGHLTLYETCEAAVPSSEVAAILHREARAAGFEIMDENGSIGRLVDRMAFLVENRAEGFTDLSINRVSLLEKACAETASFSGLRNEGLGNALRKIVPPGLLSAASGLAPDEVTLPAGRKVKVHYEPGKPPWIESQIQDFFGMMATPPVLGGRMVMVVHLLAPSRRPVQVTSDLEGFWKNHYPSVRKELSRRYPKHYWPEDGAAARPPVKTR